MNRAEMVSVQLLWSVTTGVLLLTLANADAQETIGPIIVNPPDREIILENGQNYTILCKGNRPLKIKQEEVYVEKTGRFNTTLNYGNSDYDEYWAELQLYNVDQFAVGYYACFDDTINESNVLHNIIEEPNNTAHISYTYVYVNGTNLYKPVPTIILAKRTEKFRIECKPTMPDIIVNLTTVFADIESDRYSYNPKIGFIVDSDVLTDTTNIFTCEFTKQSKVDNTDVIVYKYLLAAPKPKVISASRYFFEGESFSFNCTVPYMVPVYLNWTIPNLARRQDKNEFRIESNEKDTRSEADKVRSTLTIYNATSQDAGKYTCEAIRNELKNSTSINKILLKEPLLDVSRGGVNYKFSVESPSVAYFSISLREFYPHPNVTITHDDVILPTSKKYRMKFDVDSFRLIIYETKAEDSGVYNFTFSNGVVKSVDFFLAVLAPPEVKFVSRIDKKYDIGQYASLRCEAVGYPLPKIQWIFSDLYGNETILEGNGLKIENVNTSSYKLVSTLLLAVNMSGNITCLATNDKGADKATGDFLVYEIKDGFGIKDADKTWFSEGQSVTLKCLASIYEFNDVGWYRYNAHGDEPLTVTSTESEFSLIAELKMEPITVSQAGMYYCKATTKDNFEEIQNITITVARKQEPIIIGPPNESLEVDQSEIVSIQCVAEAIPPPIIKWYKNDKPVEFNDNIKNNVELLNVTTINSTIIIYRMLWEYQGEYECRVAYQDYVKTKTYNISIKEQRPFKMYISVAAVLFFALILLVVYLTWKIKKEKQFRKELAAAGLLYFKEGVTKSLNPDLGIDEQAELLPYDERFEFPAEKLILGKQLGAGAFGVVYKAEARGIINAEETTTVAVKMVKKTADNMYIKALASELKIMVHLGKHINIVNLLGACTKNVGKRELIVIVEYCKFGNIHNYLQKHREVFIDQLNDNIEKSLGKVNRGYSSSSANSSVDYFGSNHTQHTDHTFLNTGNTNRSGRKDTTSTKKSENKQVEFVKVSESGYVQPEWRSNYESDYSFDGRSPRPLYSRDLLAWAFQIARGMEYLASRKILHGDLAARNILLAEDNVVKICDFGLARSIYKNDEYRKKENSPLPVKWLAIECMADGIFTTQSDVWSFGIVLWELFSLAKTPYPNISPKDLLQWLTEGHRLEKPKHADDKLYDVMRRCWEQKPTARPSFTQLQEILGSFLEDNVRNHYVDLNATYMDMNVKHAGEEDYLAMVSAPDYNNLVTPSPHHYVNDTTSFFPMTPTPLQHDDEGYLQMSPTSKQNVFNTRAQGNKFDFDARELTPRVSEASECTPMLTLNNLARSGSESDQEGNVSPYMNMCPKIVEETDDDVFGTKENNAKNVQANSVTNPSYITLTINDEEKKPQKFANNYINVSVPNGLVK